MPIIEENRFFTVMVEFEVDPQQQQTLINGITNQVEQHFKSFPGFISVSFHASDDGWRVVNYVQWLSKEAWQRSFQATGNDEAKEAIDEVIKLCGAKIAKVDTFRVARVVKNA
ncbi:antibiotic biosynthesis monooxygenase [Bacillus sp. V3-13]|uniref:antibiotic biosynthesis monooxygenase family protein n=1 Tax=Bacillus sp. V3-13 TaxID=2053728 RepID=UPI000C75D7FB|nr:antibiotic biosynthesis monooxygenase [Bacillus sp. V3-13]PLR78852.1 antibiotic biosynthesis monooxygenase [Bacillus sp. V3-13]